MLARSLPRGWRGSLALLAAGWCGCSLLQPGTAFFGTTGAARRGLAVRAGAVATASIQFWNSGSCPYAQRAWIALVEKQLPFEFVKVDLQDKPADFVAVYRSVNPAEDARAKVPVVRMPDGYTMIESDVVAEYLNERFPGQGAPLMPANAEGRALVRLFLATYDQTVGSVGFSLLRATGEEELARQVEALKGHLRTLDAFLRRHSSGGGPFLCGEAFTLAEVHAGPFLQRALVTWPHFKGVDLLSLCDELELGRLREWVEATIRRPSVVETGVSPQATIENYEMLIARMAAAKT